MRIAIISPYSSGPTRGNIITVRRIISHLEDTGVTVLQLPADSLSPYEMLNSLQVFSPDIIHAFHAYHCGPVAQHLASILRKPYIISITGSDINEPVFRMHHSTASALAETAAIICFDQNCVESVKSYFPGTQDKLTIIPQGAEPLPLSNIPIPGIADDDFVLLLPATLRPVKQVEFAITASAPLTANINKLQLIIAGGTIDDSYSDKIRQLLAIYPHARWVGEIPHFKMGDIYNRADIVLNCSEYEEMPNSLLEAMLLGRPVLSADIRGNRSLVIHGNTGWLFNGESDFQKMIQYLAISPETCRQIGKQAKQYITANFSPATESKLLINLYNSVF
jgi:L-malate glycosyltransferase